MYRLVKKYVGLFIALIVVFILTVAILHIKKNINEKNDVQEMATQYFDNIISERYEQAATMIFFNSQVENFRKLAVNGFIQDKLISYEIVNIKKIADRLYELNTVINSQKTSNEKILNYALYTDNKWYIVMNSMDVPLDVYYFEDAGPYTLVPIE